MPSVPPRTKRRVRILTAAASTMVTLGAVFAWGQSGAWAPLLQSTSSLGDVERLVILQRNPSIGPFTEVVQGSEVMGGRDASDIWGMLLEPGFDPNRRDFNGDGTPDTVVDGFEPVDPYFGESSMGRVNVSSGADGQTLLDCRTTGMITTVYWCEDQNGNGTHELLVVDGEVAVLLAHAGSRVRR